MMTTKQFHTFGPVAQLVSAPPCHGGGRRFKSGQGRGGPPETVGIFGSVAQLVERTTENREGTGSTPGGATDRSPGQPGVFSFAGPLVSGSAPSGGTPGPAREGGRRRRRTGDGGSCCCEAPRRLHPRRQVRRRLVRHPPLEQG